MPKKKVIVVGAGFAGLSAAAILSKSAYDVSVLEKNDRPGGRASLWSAGGFTFDMGPSWYWMPDVFESFFAIFGKKPADYYDLVRLDPAYRVYFGPGDYLDIPASMQELEALFESMEKGAGKRLRDFLDQAAYKYKVGMSDYVYRPSLTITEFIDLRLIRESIRIQMFQSMRKHVQAYFQHPRLRKILEFPVLFLGATPQNTPAMYSMMNHADLALGTWYPMGGMHEVAKAMEAIAKEQGVTFHYGTEALEWEMNGPVISGIKTQNNTFEADIVVANGDYQHVDQILTPKPYRNYSATYWEKRTMSPSSLLFFLGIDKKLKGMKHHALFFDEDFDQHAHAIYTDARWPEKPLFYVSCTSQTDPNVAPPNQENIFILIPLAPGLPDDEARREEVYDLVMNRFEAILGEKIREHVRVKRSYAMKDFQADYHSFKGNAYGLANTLAQTAFFKPRLKSRKIENLYFTGQLTVPGPGVPPAIISGQVVARVLEKDFPL